MTRRVILLDALCREYPDCSRDELYRCIMCGEVLVGGETVTDPRSPVSVDRALTIHRRRYVSRGGEKLEAALHAWKIDAAGRSWLDAGASTGGFTDCLLQHGARRVFSVDVGYNQLDYRLRSDDRVAVMERTNILSVDDLDPQPDAAVCDLSFRSLRGVVSHLLDLTREGWGIALLKPQFEAAAEIRWGQRDADSVEKGIVRGSLRDEVIAGTIRSLEEDEGVRVIRRLASPLAGRQGNVEELLLIGRAYPLTATTVQPRKSSARRGCPTKTPSPPR
jgi:23S rRNA (cytidine1920-2'-O)/16S rRNA (cytidine1409-2'-O)-methyltransferase